MAALAAGAGLVEVVVGSSVVVVVPELLVVSATRAPRVVSVVAEAAWDRWSPASADEQAPRSRASASPAVVLFAISFGSRSRIWFLMTAFGLLRSVNRSTLFPRVATKGLSISPNVSISLLPWEARL